MPHDQFTDYESEMKKERDLAWSEYDAMKAEAEETDRVLEQALQAFKEADPEAYEAFAEREPLVRLYV